MEELGYDVSRGKLDGGMWAELKDDVCMWFDYLLLYANCLLVFGLVVRYVILETAYLSSV